MYRFWTKKDLDELEKCENFRSISKIALKVLKSAGPPPVAMICGPISTGGLGSVEKNLTVLRREARMLQKKGFTVFSQLPMEKHISRICGMPAFKSYRAENYKRLLEELYFPLFASGQIHEFYFVQNWFSSKGTNWEHDHADLFGIKKNYL